MAVRSHRAKVWWVDNKQDSKSVSQAISDSSRQHGTVVKSTEPKQDHLALNFLSASLCCVSLCELITLSVPHRPATRTQ